MNHFLHDCKSFFANLSCHILLFPPFLKKSRGCFSCIWKPPCIKRSHFVRIYPVSLVNFYSAASLCPVCVRTPRVYFGKMTNFLHFSVLPWQNRFSQNLPPPDGPVPAVKTGNFRAVCVVTLASRHFPWYNLRIAIQNLRPAVSCPGGGRLYLPFSIAKDVVPQ